MSLETLNISLSLSLSLSLSHLSISVTVSLFFSFLILWVLTSSSCRLWVKHCLLCFMDAILENWITDNIYSKKQWILKRKEFPFWESHAKFFNLAVHHSYFFHLKSNFIFYLNLSLLLFLSNFIFCLIPSCTHIGNLLKTI